MSDRGESSKKAVKRTKRERVAIEAVRVQSSKKATKRTKWERVAIEAALRNDPDKRVNISSGASNEYSGDLPDIPSTKESPKSKKKRGPTRCRMMTMEHGRRVEVKFNERGQAIDAESVKLSSFLGVIVRETIPITYNDWRRVPQEKKDVLWELVMQKFILDEGQSKVYVLQLMGRLWRTYKSRLMAIVQACENEEEVGAAKPHHLDNTEWENFLGIRSSSDFMKKRAKFKEMRANQILPHTCSRKGFARLEDQMRKESPTPSSISRFDVWTRGHTKKSGKHNPTTAEYLQKLQEIRQTSSPMSSSTSLKNDALSQLLGPERHGRVRGVGFGVTPSKVGASTHSTSKVAQLEEELSSVKAQMKDMQKMIAMLMNDKGNTSTHSYHSHHSQGIKCKLFRLVKEDVVAEGRWVTDDPNTVVHHVPLGSGASKVWVDHATEPRARLWRATNGMERMEDAIGSTIAWPTDHIIKEAEIGENTDPVV